MVNFNSKLDGMLASPLTALGWTAILAPVPDGILIELGVWEGSSFREICARVYPRKVYGFDWWRGLPEEWEFGGAGVGDMGGIPPPCPDNGEFIIGLVEDTLPDFVVTHAPAAFVHFDLDLYAGTAAALACLKFAPGAILVFDEIVGADRNIRHEQRAFREWLARTNQDFELIGQRHAESWVVQLK